MRHNQYVAFTQAQVIVAQRCKNQLCKIIPGLYQGKTQQGDQLQSVGHLVRIVQPGNFNTRMAAVLLVDRDQH